MPVYIIYATGTGSGGSSGAYFASKEFPPVFYPQGYFPGGQGSSGGGTNCCCGSTPPPTDVLTTCCDPILIPRTLFATMHWDWTPDPDYDTPVTLTYDDLDGKWKGTTSCNGTAFELQVYCDGSPTPGNWFFDIIKGGVSYGVPGFGIPGGATLNSCSPFDLDGLISTPADFLDFPLCAGHVAGDTATVFINVTE